MKESNIEIISWAGQGKRGRPPFVEESYSIGTQEGGAEFRRGKRVFLRSREGKKGMEVTWQL